MQQKNYDLTSIGTLLVCAQGLLNSIAMTENQIREFVKRHVNNWRARQIPCANPNPNPNSVTSSRLKLLSSRCEPPAPVMSVSVVVVAETNVGKNAQTNAQ